ncbi:hypothetical protein DM56_1407 [Burkholderia mallei]|nr:hypothetical protein DM75_1510 [Burkholderia mallei]KOS76476.1 hypothetical protein DM46_1401 [Burkholderia mallei]KOS86737.1 hypothetical protein DM45_407 [Burkholderia mallei]KOS94400.1 hypothetical protein DM49_795 [Burkholderia mallei]KOT00472.1 hypothetical protein DM50_1505 [Burkholderia mallei]
MRVRKASHRRLEYHRLECEAGITSERSRRQARRSRTLERPLHGEKPMTNATDHGYPDRSAFAAMRKRQFDAAPSAFRQRSLNVPSTFHRRSVGKRRLAAPENRPDSTALSRTAPFERYTCFSRRRTRRGQAMRCTLSCDGDRRHSPAPVAANKLEVTRDGSYFHDPNRSAGIPAEGPSNRGGQGRTSVSQTHARRSRGGRGTGSAVARRPCPPDRYVSDQRIIGSGNRDGLNRLHRAIDHGRAPIPLESQIIQLN